jgi:long-chain acyl-CoA synthetase
MTDAAEHSPTDGLPDPFATVRQSVHGADVLVFANPVVGDLRELLQLAEAQPPDRSYLIEDDRDVRFGELVGRVGGIAAGLLDGCGLRSGDRIAISAANSIEWALTAWAAVATGRIVVGLNSWWHPAETLSAIAISTPRVLVLDERQLKRLAPHLAELESVEHILVLGEGTELSGDPRVRRFDEVCTGEAPLPAADIDPDDVATILFTSGTTGNAKGVIGTHRAATATYQNVMWAGMRYFPTVFLKAPSGPPAAPSTVLSAPMFHVAGLQWGVMFGVGMGGTTILNTGRYDPDTVMAMTERHGCTSLGGVPTMMTRIVDSPTRDRYDLSSVTSVSWGGAPPPTSLIDGCIETFPNLVLIGTGYGLTETCGLLLYATGTDYVGQPQTVGKAFPTAEVRVSDPLDHPLEVGIEGEIQVRGPMVMPGYWERPDATRDALTEDGWLRTGDLGVIDDNGFVTLTGRAKELIIRGGENVYPSEIEDVLCNHGAVLDAAAVGRPHPDLGEEVVAVVQVNTDVDPDELRAWVADRLAGFKVPVEITVHSNPLPRNAAGKLLRDAIAGGEVRLTETL